MDMATRPWDEITETGEETLEEWYVIAFWNGTLAYSHETVAQWEVELEGYREKWLAKAVESVTLSFYAEYDVEDWDDVHWVGRVDPW